jgi:hypothetical protein
MNMDYVNSTIKTGATMKDSTLKVLIATAVSAVTTLAVLPLVWAGVGLIIIALVAYNSLAHPEEMQQAGFEPLEPSLNDDLFYTSSAEAITNGGSGVEIGNGLWI